jgi:two-component system response regulator FixJ
MIGDAERHVFVLDDEPEVCEAIRRILEAVGIRVSCFCDPAVCVAKLRSLTCHLLITDLKMPRMDGMDLLKEVKRLTPWVPVLVISGYGDIETAVRAIKAGAVDFVEKPLYKMSLVQKVKSILPGGGFIDPRVGSPLTPAETNVLRLVLDGRSSKEIARQLHRSLRTIEGHRSNLMRKLNAENIFDLLKRVSTMRLIDMVRKQKVTGVVETLG